MDFTSCNPFVSLGSQLKYSKRISVFYAYECLIKNSVKKNRCLEGSYQIPYATMRTSKLFLIDLFKHQIIKLTSRTSEIV